MTLTPIDNAHAAMESASEDVTARMRFYERLAESELFVLLKHEATGDDVAPQLVEVDGVRYVLAFDREERLAEFAEGPAPYLAISGRALAGMLHDQDLGLGLNPDVAPSSFLVPPAAIAWLQDVLDTQPEGSSARALEVSFPEGLSEVLLAALDAKLSLARGLAGQALLASVAYQNGADGYILAFIDPVSGSEQALAQAVNEALIFSGAEGFSLDVSFFNSTDPLVPRLAATALRIDIPAAAEAQAKGPTKPGGTPKKPPILR